MRLYCCYALQVFAGTILWRIRRDSAGWRHELVFPASSPGLAWVAIDGTKLTSVEIKSSQRREVMLCHVELRILEFKSALT